MQENQNQELLRRRRAIPISDLDFNLMTTNTEWGGQYIPEELRRKLQRDYIEVINGQQYLKKEGLWEMLGFYTRDMRLGNLSEFNGELNYCTYYLDLANDFLRDDFVEPFLISLSRAATILELSQSKKGFLRRRMGTFTQEHYQQELDPKKKNFFGMGKKEV